jgi:hypothetical protein
MLRVIGFAQTGQANNKCRGRLAIEGIQVKGRLEFDRRRKDSADGLGRNHQAHFLVVVQSQQIGRFERPLLDGLDAALCNRTRTASAMYGGADSGNGATLLTLISQST